MAQNVIYVRATQAEVIQAVSHIPTVARSGGVIANAMMTRCGLAALGFVYKAFIVKSLGGVDEAGDSWVPLKPETIAYSRRHVKKFGDPKQSRVFTRYKETVVATRQPKRRVWIPKPKIRAGYAPSYALTNKQKDRWWDLYRHGLAMFSGDKGRAARRAWVISKSEGATTLIAQYGNTKVKILDSTGVLLNSLSPGSNSDKQVFRVRPGEVIVGTNRKFASTHHEGKEHIPQRRLWPEPSRWPSNWWLNIAEQAKEGLVDIAIKLVRSI